VSVTFNVAAADFELDQDAAHVDQLDINYPIELNGQVIGHFNPTELPYTCNLCESDATSTVHFDIDPNSFNWNYGASNELDLNFYEFGSDNNSLQDVCVANVVLSFDTEACANILPPSNPSCDNGSFLWENSIDLNTLNGGAGVPAADLRFIDGQTTQFVIPGPYPAEFDNAVTLCIDEAISWDGYLNRGNVTQSYEQWKVVFKNNGNVVYESAYTQDTPDQAVSAEWVGALDCGIYLPNGTDEIILVHIEDSQYGDGSFSSANSVVPSSLCISYEQDCILEIKNLGNCTVDLYEWLPGGDVFLEELSAGESISVSTSVGAMWRIVGDGWDTDAFDEHYTVLECGDDLVWNVAPSYCDPGCNLAVDAGSNQTVCPGDEATFTASTSNESSCEEIIACYTMNNSTMENCGGTPGSGVVWQRGEEGEGCSGSHLIWQAGNDLKLTEFANGTAHISGTITRNGLVGQVDVTLYDQSNSGNTWNAQCYLDGISGTESYYTSFLGTITVGNDVYTVEEKVSEMHYILAQGAGFQNTFGLGAWSAGTFGTCTEWFAHLEPCDIPNQELTYLWSNGATTSSITVSEEGTYSVTVTDCSGCTASDQVNLHLDDLPEADASVSTPECNAELGEITFTFPDHPSRTNIEFSIDGGASYPYNFSDNEGSVTISDIAAGTYDLWARWGNDDCPTNIEDVTIIEGPSPIAYDLIGGAEFCVDGEGDFLTDADIQVSGSTEGTNMSFVITDADGNILGLPGTLADVFGVDFDGAGAGTCLVASTSSDENGAYNFNVCYEPNTSYYINASNIPSGFELTGQDGCGDDNTDSDADESGNTECFNVPEDGVDNIDFGITGLPNIGDTVFYDDNRNGIQDADEDGVEGVTVELVSAGDDGIFGTADDVVEDTQVTDENGNYLFEDVIPGEYKITFSNLPADYVFSPANQGGDDALDSDANEMGMTEPFAVESGQDDDLTFDAGINLPTAVRRLRAKPRVLCSIRFTRRI